MKLENRKLGTMFERKSRLDHRNQRKENITHRNVQTKTTLSPIEALGPLQLGRAHEIHRADIDFEFQLEKYNYFKFVFIEQYIIIKMIEL